MSPVELYALPMARWLVLVAILLESYRVALIGFRMYSEGRGVVAVLHELRTGMWLAAIAVFYTSALFLHDPLEPAGRRDIITINLLYAMYFLTNLTGRYVRMDRRANDHHDEDL